MDDLRARDVDLLTIGQYLRPTKHHLAGRALGRRSASSAWRDVGLEQGFRRSRPARSCARAIAPIASSTGTISGRRRGRRLLGAQTIPAQPALSGDRGARRPSQARRPAIDALAAVDGKASSSEARGSLERSASGETSAVSVRPAPHRWPQPLPTAASGPRRRSTAAHGPHRLFFARASGRAARVRRAASRHAGTRASSSIGFGLAT